MAYGARLEIALGLIAPRGFKSRILRHEAGDGVTVVLGLARRLESGRDRVPPSDGAPRGPLS